MMTDDVRSSGYPPPLLTHVAPNGHAWSAKTNVVDKSLSRPSMDFPNSLCDVRASGSYNLRQLPNSFFSQPSHTQEKGLASQGFSHSPFDTLKDRHFHAQQEKLRHMVLPKGSKKLSPDDLISTILESSVKQNGKKAGTSVMSSFHLPASSSRPDDFGDFVAAFNAEPVQNSRVVGTMEQRMPPSEFSVSQGPSSFTFMGITNGDPYVNSHAGLIEIVAQGRAPKWLIDPNSAPHAYQELARSVCQGGSSKPDPQKAFNIFASSSLPGPVLSQLWSLVHPRDSDPSFEMPEFFAILALIGQIQHSGKTEVSQALLESLLKLPVPLVPSLGIPIASRNDSAPSVEEVTISQTPATEQPSSPGLRINFGFSPPVFEKVKFPPKNEIPDDEVDDDFGDFQSSILTPSSPVLMSSNEDKYAALRTLSAFQEAPPQPSTITPLDEPVLSAEVFAPETPVVPDSPDSLPSLPEIVPLENLPPPLSVATVSERFVSPIVKRRTVAQVIAETGVTSREEDDFGDFVAAFGQVGAGDAVIIQEETRSVASLDFAATLVANSNGSEGDSDSCSNWVVNPLESGTTDGKGVAEEISMTVTNTPNVDKYSVFRDLSDSGTVDRESSKSGEVVTEFVKLWTCGSSVFRETSEFLEEARRDDCLDAFVSNRKCQDYLLCVVEIFAVGARAHAAFCESFGGCEEGSEGRRSWDSFLDTFKEVLAIVRLSQNQVLENFTVENLMSLPSTAGNQSRCGVCLTSAADPTSPLGPDSEKLRLNTQSIQWGVSRYHVSCANLWLNRIHSVLPALSL